MPRYPCNVRKAFTLTRVSQSPSRIIRHSQHRPGLAHIGQTPLVHRLLLLARRKRHDAIIEQIPDESREPRADRQNLGEQLSPPRRRHGPNLLLLLFGQVALPGGAREPVRSAQLVDERDGIQHVLQHQTPDGPEAASLRRLPGQQAPLARQPVSFRVCLV